MSENNTLYAEVNGLSLCIKITSFSAASGRGEFSGELVQSSDGGYNPAFVEEIKRAAKLPPEATFNNATEMLAWLNQPSDGGVVGEPVAWQHRLRECGGWSGWTLIGKGFHDAIAADKAEGRREDYDLRELYADPRPDLPPLVDRAELIALLDDLASVNLSREACARQATRMADDLIARGLAFSSTTSETP